ncbi:polysaccharide biosynthesis tyrosine autokinase [Nostoc spongiaeforme FACHB-130]|uniref:Polysaccharide biosynthesis tyrosine autokinase n=1 Tax=Nostoc spongiaeforme FACHB-130 TaxID=1357510 RepID=A0ABR8FUS6_9NOSO|nr:polysaccharide biosynthesis tyrosine autokinase [Nostoc spongiaeforme]MBD2593997.1 polysaccharide biosynthesis tyrosine autokinase [Nostoc spongiaeforme FACHB-130]
MDNYRSQYSNSGHNNNPEHLFSSNQSLPWNEESEGGWNLQEVLDIVQRRWLIISGVATVAMVVIVTGLTLNPAKPEYEAGFQILVEPVSEDSKSVDVVKDTNSNSNQSTLDYDSQIQILKSPVILDDVVKRVQITYPDISYDFLAKYLNVFQLGKTKIIQVTYRDNDPDKVKLILDKTAQSYLEYSKEKRQTKLGQGLQFVETQLKISQNRVDQLQQQLQTLKQIYNLNDPETETKALDTETANLTEQKQTINFQLAQARANLALLQQPDGAKAALNTAVLYQQLISQKNQIDTQVAADSTRFQPDNPTLQSLKEKRDSLLPLINQEAKRILDTKRAEILTGIRILEAHSLAIEKREQELQQKRKQLPILSRKYTDLQRKLQVAIDSLNRFLSTRESLQIQKSQTEFSWELVQSPVRPGFPATSSSFKKNLLWGLVASLAIGVGVALLLEKLDSTYNSVKDLKEKIKLPLLGNIPFEKQIQTEKNNYFFPRNLPLIDLPKYFSEFLLNLNVATVQESSNYNTNFVEALRVLYTNIQLLNSDHPIRSIVITSSMPSDGKSTVAFNLAQIATAMGQKVLLVDADLRKPTIHTLSNLNNIWGLSNLISTNLPVGEAIQEIPTLSQLSVITSGPIPPDATKLLSSERMKRLMNEFHNSFDLVIYDVPPLVGLADVSLLAPNTDGILMVVKIGKTQSSVLNRAIENLKLSRLNILGIVGNGDKTTFKSY